MLDTYPLEILKPVLDATVPIESRRLMGAVLKARVSRFPASLSEAQKLPKTESPAATDEMRSCRLDQAAAAVRYLLATAENVHAWSHACLDHMIRKTMEMRPSTLINEGTGRTSREIFETAERHSNDYVPQYTGPPSWVEEQRMIKAFWRLQFFLELQDAGNKGLLVAHWPRQDVDVLCKSSPDRFYDMFAFEQHQTMTASDFLNAVTSGTIDLAKAMYGNVYGLPTICWVEGTVPRCSCTEPPSFEHNMDTFRQGPEHLDRTPMSYQFQHNMSIQWLDGLPPLYDFPFHPWRKYGFAIWDDKRMADLGMRDRTHKPITRHYRSYSFRWFSILSEEELPQNLRRY